MPKSTRSTVQRPPRGDRRPVLSLSTVLILSGFLVGMSVGTSLTPEMRALVSISGLLGMVSFIGLDHVSARRRERNERQEQEYMESRLTKHVDASESVVLDHSELRELARQATSVVDLEELIPGGRR